MHWLYDALVSSRQPAGQSELTGVELPGWTRHMMVKLVPGRRVNVLSTQQMLRTSHALVAPGH